MVKALLHKVTSRKFLLALSGFIAALANKQYDNAAYIVLAYLGVEGGVDALRTRAGGD